MTDTRTENHSAQNSDGGGSWKEKWVPDPAGHDHVDHAAELTTAERRYENLMNAMTDVLAGLRDELRDIDRDLKRIKRTQEDLQQGQVNLLQAVATYGRGAQREAPAPVEEEQREEPSPEEESNIQMGPERVRRKDASIPFASVEEQMGSERYQMWLQAGRAIKRIREKHGVTYKQMRQFMKNDPVWTSSPHGVQVAPNPTRFSELESNYAPWDEKKNRFFISFGGKTSLEKLLAALSNLDGTLCLMSGMEPDESLGE